MPHFKNVTKRTRGNTVVFSSTAGKEAGGARPKSTPRTNTKAIGGDSSGQSYRSTTGDAQLTSNTTLQVTCGIDEYNRSKDYANRRLFIIGEIISVEESNDSYALNSMCGDIVEKILQYNREDYGLPAEKRTPIKIYINSPGGNSAEGFAVIAAIKTSQTPVYTINIGQWCSMAFLIGIAGEKRFSLPYMQFLLHEGYNGAIGSVGKVQDKIKFDERFEKEVVRPHILEHSNGKMTAKYYDTHVQDEIYMLPEDALSYGFIYEIVTKETFDEIL